jgi:hypothetical protein
MRTEPRRREHEREHIVILDVSECLMAEEIIFCHNTSLPTHRTSIRRINKRTVAVMRRENKT